jgi:sugar/nucleoside kinase (ribokinase family)
VTRVDLALRPETSEPGCVGIGFVAADIVEGSAEEFVAAGGSCGNVLAILAWLGWKSVPVGRMGQDWASKVIRKDFAALGVEETFLSTERGIQTPIVIQRFVQEKSGRRVHRFSLACPECGGWLPRYRASTLGQAAEVVNSKIVPKVLYMDRISPAAVHLATWAKEQGALVVFEPSSIADERQFQRAVDLCHLLKFSHDRLGHVRDLRETQGPKIIVETCAEKGLRFRWRGHWTELSAFQTPRFLDGAGAGDWCTAGLIHRLGSGGAKTLETLQKPRLLAALRFGQALAAVNCGYEGARGAMMAMSRLQLAKRLMTLTSRRPEPETMNDEVAGVDTDIPKKLCGSCSKPGKKTARKRRIR